jgi:hypothetical protein
MVGLAVMSSEGAGVSAAACTAFTCCNVAIPKLDPLTTTTINSSVCSEGTLPGGALGKLVNLQLLNLPYMLSGSIPPEIGDLVALTDLSVAGNVFFPSKMSGTIPPEIGALVALTSLYLAVYSPFAPLKLSGTIPGSIGKLAGLQRLYLYSTGISGSIPTTIGALVALGYLDLSYTSIEGTIPEDVGKLTNLQQLSLGSTGISGTILKTLIQNDGFPRRVTPKVGEDDGMVLTILPHLNHPHTPPSIPPTGTIPGSIGKLAGLQVLFLFSTGISGTDNVVKNLIPKYGLSKRVMIQRSDTAGTVIQSSLLCEILALSHIFFCSFPPLRA